MDRSGRGSQTSLDGDMPDLVVALPVREQRDVDAMGDGPVAGIDTERPCVGDEVPGHFFVVVAGAALLRAYSTL